MIPTTARAAFAATSLAFAALAQSSPLQWVRGTTPGPSPRYGAAMSYDLHRGCLVLFGGSGIPDLFGDTWEFDGFAWHQRAPAHAPRPGSHGMVYDVAHRRTLLLAFGLPMETWAWDGNDWTLVARGGITPRVACSLVHDLLRGVTVAFGGAFGAAPLGDTWEWDGAAWTQRAATGPSPRLGAMTTYDLAHGVTVLFGGETIDHLPLDGTFTWDGRAWTDRNVPGPSPRHQAAMAYDFGLQRCVLIGGVDVFGTYLRETWEWDDDSWRRTSVAMPMAGSLLPALACDVARDRLIVHGGGAPFFTAEPGWWIGTRLPPAPALLTGLGQGCGALAPRLAPGFDQLPRLGSRCRLGVSGLPPAGRGLVLGLCGRTPVDGSLRTLPLDPFGFPGCALALDPEAATALPRQDTTATWDVLIPWAPELLGLSLDLQVLGAEPGTLLLSNGLRLAVGLA